MGKKNNGKYEVYTIKGKTQIQNQEVEDNSLGELLDDNKSINNNPSNQLISCYG